MSENEKLKRKLVTLSNDIADLGFAVNALFAIHSAMIGGDFEPGVFTDGLFCVQQDIERIQKKMFMEVEG